MHRIEQSLRNKLDAPKVGPQLRIICEADEVGDALARIMEVVEWPGKPEKTRVNNVLTCPRMLAPRGFA
jgi:hypothetical protein